MKKSMILIASLAAIAFLFGCSSESENPVNLTLDDQVLDADKGAGNYGLNIIPPRARPHGKSYSEWSMAWWQWLWSAPVDQNPGLDETGEFVTLNQSGKVWFLAPAYYGQWERSAVIPTGKMLFIDLAGFFVSIEMGDGADEAELRSTASMFVDAVISNVILEVDGQRLTNVEDFRFASPPGLYGYTLPENNMFEFFEYEIPAGTYENDAVSEGYYAMLPPLSRGEHTIFLSAEFGDPYNDIIQVTYHLTVAPGGSRRHNSD